MSEPMTSRPAGPLPDLTRGDGADVAYVLVGTWRVADPARQRAAAAAALDARWNRPWPPGLLAHSMLLGTDGHTLLHYSQWTDSGAAEEIRRAAGIAAGGGLDGGTDTCVDGVAPVAATAYRLYRSAVPARPLEPGG